GVERSKGRKVEGSKGRSKRSSRSPPGRFRPYAQSRVDAVLANARRRLCAGDPNPRHHAYRLKSIATGPFTVDSVTATGPLPISSERDAPSQVRRPSSQARHFHGEWF